MGDRRPRPHRPLDGGLCRRQDRRCAQRRAWVVVTPVVLANARSPARALALVAITPGSSLAKTDCCLRRYSYRLSPIENAVWVLAFARTTMKNGPAACLKCTPLPSRQHLHPTE